MTSPRAELTPQMEHYTFLLEDQPYIGFFQYGNEHKPAFNTDNHGFRISRGPAGELASVASERRPGPVRLLAGSSTVFGVGATSDAGTMPSRLWARYAPRQPWLNFAGQSHNSAQELVLFALFAHLVPEVEEIVLFSGINNLVLSRLPAEKQGRHGAFFECGPGNGDQTVPTAAERIAHAAELTLRHLKAVHLLARALDASLTFVLQPLASWVREEPAPQEKLLFEELDQISNFPRLHNDIAPMHVGKQYARELQDGCDEIGIRFLDMNAVLADAAKPDEWLFVDRVHCVDRGYDLIARLLAECLGLG